jgi:NADH-quinone oxidoreductase subunit G
MLPILAWDEKKKDYVEAVKPKLQPACQIEATEGMEVLSKSKEAVQAQASVQEFLLLNHPVDCPICDQAGECKLQDYWLAHQTKGKRKDTEPVHKPKAVRFGETIVYDGERCIMCTRCIRFCDEVVGDHVLDMRERGNKNEICLSPGRTLDHEYTLMTEHVCPVGALTSKDFRFKARVWFLKSAQGVCTGCATGCNTWVDFDPRYQRVERLRPRDNADVNKFWMCDAGMLSYHRFHQDRLVTGRVRSEGAVHEAPRGEAIAAAADALKNSKKLAVVLSAQHSTEDNFVVLKLARDLLGARKVYLGALDAQRTGWHGDEILRHADNNPNRAGALQVAGEKLEGTAALAKTIEAGEVDAVLSLGFAAEVDAAALAPLSNVPHVNLASHGGPLSQLASVVMPVATVAEASGTFVNAKGKSQAFQRAVQAPAGITSAWQTMTELATALGHETSLKKLPDVRAAMPALAAGA